MQIGEFVRTMGTTVDTVRYYMELSILQPELERGRYHFGGKEIRDFQAIAQLKQWGFTVKEIQKLFEHKRNSGCGTAGLLQYAQDLLQGRIQTIDSEMAQLMRQRELVQENLAEIEQAIMEQAQAGAVSYNKQL